MARNKELQSDLFLNVELSEKRIPTAQKERLSELLADLMLSVLGAEAALEKREKTDNE